MTRHININILFLLIFGFSLSCKENENSKSENNPKYSIEIKTDSITDLAGYTTWYPSLEINNENYKKLKIYINKDSIKVVKENKIICKGEIVKEKLTFKDYFKSEKNGRESKEKLINAYGLNDSENLLVIMNAYGDISKIGCQFPFNNLFIFDNHLFFFDKGYQCFLLSKDTKALIDTKTENFLKFSTTALPYNKKISFSDVKYNTINVNSISGLENFSCEEPQVRYIPLPSKNQINLILVPQDCADFPYRFYLLSVKNNKIISDLYVEGEWFEPENYLNKELTSFEITEDFIIKVTTVTNEKGKEIENYLITNDGTIIKK